MRRTPVAAMMWKSVGLIGALGLLCWAGASVAGDVPRDRASWQEKYRRPAEIPFPEDNPYSEAKSKLGRMLFFDPILSGSRTRACAICHNRAVLGRRLAARDRRKAAAAARSDAAERRVGARLGWDGHFRNLEAVAFGPISSPNNMNLPERADRAPFCHPGLCRGVRCLLRRRRDHAAEHRIGARDIRAFDRVRPKRHSTAGSKAMKTPLMRRPSAASICSTARPTARPATAAGRSPTARFTISARRRQRYRPRQTVSELGQTALRLQDADAARRCPPRALYARRLGCDVGGGDRSL